MLAQDTQTLNLRYHQLEVRNHWLIAIAVFAVGVLLVVGALFAYSAFTLSADESTAQQSLTILDSGTTDGLDGVYTWSAQFVDSDGVLHNGIDQIRAMFAADQAAGTRIDSIGDPTTAGSIVTTPFTWSNSFGYEGNGTLVTQIEEGKIVYATLVVDAD